MTVIGFGGGMTCLAITRRLAGDDVPRQVLTTSPDIALALGACSLHAAVGLTTYCAGEAEVLRGQARCAGRLMVTTESAKLGSTAAHVVAAAADVAQLVTDAAAPGEELDALRALGVEVVIA